MSKVLVIEDENNLLMAIKDNLEFEGYDVAISLNGKDGLDRAINEAYDIIILDIMLPEVDGFDILRELRKVKKEIPVIIISAKNLDEDKVFGLNSGADDYIIKPFSIMELIARIRAQLRRVKTIKGANIKRNSPYPGYEPISLRIGNALIYLDKMVAKVGKIENILTPKEIGIIRLLYKNRGKVVTRELMMKEIWGEDVYVTERVIDTNVVSIRKKIGDSKKSRSIKTVFGVGYKMIEG